MSASIEEQYDKIYRYCYFKVHNQYQAEDLTQETFLRYFAQTSYINRVKTTWSQFIRTQAGYVHKAVWILSAALVLLAVIAGSSIFQERMEQEYELLWFVSAVMPPVEHAVHAESTRIYRIS